MMRWLAGLNIGIFRNIFIIISQQAVRTCPGGNYCDWRPHSPTWSDEAARRSHHERWRGSCPYYAVGWEETRTEKSIKIYKNKFVLETNLHVTDHPGPGPGDSGSLMQTLNIFTNWSLME